MIILTCMQKEVDKKANKAPNRTNIKLEHTSKTPIVSSETINDILIMILYHQWHNIIKLILDMFIIGKNKLRTIFKSKLNI